MSTSAALAHIDALARMVTTEVEQLTGPAGRAAKAECQAVAAQLGPLSKMGRRGVKLSSGYDLENGGARIVLKLRPPGPWVITERKSKAHVIQPRRARRRAASKGGRRPAIAAGGWGHPVAAVDHPGGAGRQGITRAFGRARRVIPEAIHAQQVRRMRAVFGG